MYHIDISYRKENYMKKMIIIGAGAAGMMTAVHASKNYDVTIIEKNEKPGKKLFITGKGRCNVTNNCDEETFLKNVITNPKFLYSSIYNYNQSSVMKDFEKWGVKLKTERGNRVFPESDHSSDVIKALTEQMKKCSVKIIYNTEVVRVITEKRTESNDSSHDSSHDSVNCSGEANKNSSDLVATGVEIISQNSKNRKILKADVIVIATGGYSYQTTGSTGDGYKFVKDMGVDVTPIRSGLVPIVTREAEVKDLMGLSLKNVSLKVTALKENFPKLKKDKVIFEDFGEMLFTHFGISGPLVLSAASYISLFVYKERHKMISADEEESFIMDNNISGIKMEIDLKPALSIDELDKRILRDFDEFHNREFQNSLGKLLPRLLIPVIVKRSGIKAQKKVNEITAEERIKLRDTLKHFTLNMHSFRGFNEAIITGGGISVKEINPQTMELKKVKNLRVAGEVIDVDALTGGFNLQIAWSTAKIAAEI